MGPRMNFLPVAVRMQNGWIISLQCTVSLFRKALLIGISTMVN